jgi:hypothetical protein
VEGLKRQRAQEGFERGGGVQGPGLGFDVSLWMSLEWRSRTDVAARMLCMMLISHRNSPVFQTVLPMYTRRNIVGV